MHIHGRIALVCATAALAAAPSTALARPATEQPVPGSSHAIDAPPAQRSAAPVVREIRTNGDTTLALVLSGSALLIAAGAAAVSGHDHRRLGKIA